MTDYRYVKTTLDTPERYLPFCKELVGLHVGYPEADNHRTYRYPNTTTIHMSLAQHSYQTYAEALANPPYLGPTP